MDRFESFLDNKRRFATKSTMSARLHIILRNPMIRIVLSYLHQIDPNSKDFNGTNAGMTFQEFLDGDYVQHNLLTKSLVCKKADDELNQDDLEYAKYFISNKCDVKFYYNQDHEKALSDIKNVILNNEKNYDGPPANSRKGINMQSANDKILTCVSYEVARNWIPYPPSRIEKIILKHGNDLLERNSYDMELYSLALGLYLGRD